MISLKKLTDFRKKDQFDSYIHGINTIRSNYQWSQKSYDDSEIDNVYLIKYGKNFVGFIEASFQNLDICHKKPLILFLHELHICSTIQGKGVGASTLKLLLDKGVSIEMVVANKNTNMLKLIEKLDAQTKYISENTRTVIISPKIKCV